MATTADDKKTALTIRVITGQTETGNNKLGSVSFQHVASDVDISQNETIQALGQVSGALSVVLGVETDARLVIKTLQLIDA